MDPGLLLESPQGSQSSSRVGACTSDFLPRCSSSVTHPSRGSWDQWLSIEAFPRGFPTRLSHEVFPQGCPTCHHSKTPPDISVCSKEPVFPALPRLSRRDSTHTTVTRGTALWESLVGKTRGKATSLGPRKGNRDTAATAWEEMARSRPHSRRGLTPLWRLQKYPKIHVSTGEESSASGPDSTQGLRPQHRRERNHERPPSNTHDNWPFLRPPERVPESPS